MRPQGASARSGLRGLVDRLRTRRPPAERRRRLLTMVAVASLTLSVGAVLGNGGYLDRLRYESEHERLEREVLSLQLGVAALEREVAALDGSAASTERLAREELGLARPGEILVLLAEPTRAARPERATPAVVPRR